MKRTNIIACLGIFALTALPTLAHAEMTEETTITEITETESMPDGTSLTETIATNEQTAEETTTTSDDKTRCRISYNMKSWSLFYKSGSGEGRISCDNGQTADVRINTNGGGLTFGKKEINEGHGTFTKVASISDLYGSYAYSDAHAGIVKSADAKALTKGKISLAVTGTGKGYDLGFAFGKFTITPVSVAQTPIMEETTEVQTWQLGDRKVRSEQDIPE